MKKTIIGAFLAVFALSATAQDWEEKLPVTYKIAAVQKIDADIYQLTYNTQNNSVYVAGPKGEYKIQDDKVEYPGKQYVYVLDGNSLAVKDSILLESNFAALGIGINNKTQTLYVGHSFNQAITAIDLKTKKQTLIPSGRPKSKIREVVVDETNNLVYVSDHGDPSIWVVDGSTNKYKSTISVPDGFIIGLNVDAKRNRIYATDGSGAEQYVRIFDGKHKPVSKWKTWGANSLNIAIDDKDNRLFVSENGDNKVSVINANNGEIITKISLGSNAQPVGLVYDPSKNLVYVANRGKKEVAVLDAKTYKLIERIPTKGLPNTVVLDKATGAVYVTNKALYVEEGKTAEVLENANTVQKIVKM